MAGDCPACSAWPTGLLRLRRVARRDELPEHAPPSPGCSRLRPQLRGIHGGFPVQFRRIFRELPGAHLTRCWLHQSPQTQPAHGTGHRARPAIHPLTDQDQKLSLYRSMRKGPDLAIRDGNPEILPGMRGVVFPVNPPVSLPWLARGGGSGSAGKFAGTDRSDLQRGANLVTIRS